MRDPFDFLYEPYDHEKEAFGEAWRGPEKYKHGEEHLVALYKRDSEDGHTVEIYCVAMPARFYRIKVMESVNSVGDPKPAFELGTGSSMADLAASIGDAISKGMLGLKTK